MYVGKYGDSYITEIREHGFKAMSREGVKSTAELVKFDSPEALKKALPFYRDVKAVKLETVEKYLNAKYIIYVTCNGPYSFGPYVWKKTAGRIKTTYTEQKATRFSTRREAEKYIETLRPAAYLKVAFTVTERSVNQ